MGMKFKLIPAGKFTMGGLLPIEGDDAHEVTLTKPFKMGVHEVTQAQYEQVMGSNPSKFEGADNPVENVSWLEALEFCRKLSALPAEKAAGNVYRLPTEAEWEYACRAGTTTQFSFGDDDSDLGDYAWYADNSDDKTHPVGSKQPNAWGLYDMHGNVWEWCLDWHGDYPSGAVTDPTGPSEAWGSMEKDFKTVDKNSDGYLQKDEFGVKTDSDREVFTNLDTNKDDQISVTELVAGFSFRVFRGGCWGCPAGFCRSAYRESFPSYRSSYYGGFRVSLSPSGK